MNKKGSWDISITISSGWHEVVRNTLTKQQQAEVERFLASHLNSKLSSNPIIHSVEIKFGGYPWVDITHKTKLFVAEYDDDDVQAVMDIETEIDEALEEVWEEAGEEFGLL